MGEQKTPNQKDELYTHQSIERAIDSAKCLTTYPTSKINSLRLLVGCIDTTRKFERKCASKATVKTPNRTT
jgi:hypothetical protein